MLQLTVRAMTHLKSSITKQGLKSDQCFRLDMTHEGIKVSVDRVREGDAVVRHGSQVLLVFDPESNSCYEGLVMDYDESAKELTFNA